MCVCVWPMEKMGSDSFCELFFYFSFEFNFQYISNYAVFTTCGSWWTKAFYSKTIQFENSTGNQIIFNGYETTGHSSLQTCKCFNIYVFIVVLNFRFFNLQVLFTSLFLSLIVNVFPIIRLFCCCLLALYFNCFSFFTLFLFHEYRMNG